MKKDRLLRAALAGLTMGVAAPGAGVAQEAPSEVKCYGINACGAHAKCGTPARILNWVPESAAECKAQGGILVEEGAGKKKVARKA